MKSHAAVAIAVGIAAFTCSGATKVARAQTSDTESGSNIGETQELVLTPAQRRTIYDAVAKDKSKTAKPQFPATVGAAVPPMIELYTLPDQVMAENRTANLYEYTLVQDKVVLVDPTKMRVIDVIGPSEQQ